MEEKDLKQALDNLKAELEKANTEKAKKEIADQINAFEEKHKDILTSYKALQDEVEQLKKDATANQEVIDAFVKAQKEGPKVPEQQKSLSLHLKDAIEKDKDSAEKFFRGETKRFGFDLNSKAVADVSLGNVTGGTVYGASYRPGIIMAQNEIGHVRDFIPVNPAPDASATDYYFMRENGAGEGAPAPTSEKQTAAATTQATGLKPQFDIDLVEASVKFETIAGFLKASNKALRTIKGLMDFLNKRLPQKLYDVEDTQVLYGNGTSPNLKGILTSGNFVAGSAAGATALSEKIITDLATFEDTYKRLANFVAMRPVDYWSFFKQKASGSGEYDLPDNFVFVNGQLFISGVPVYKTTRLTQYDYFLGDRNGAEILIAENLRIELFREDGTNVQTNQVTIRIEETIALPVYGSDYFMKGSSNPTGA